jgi:hypothetical protein
MKYHSPKHVIPGVLFPKKHEFQEHYSRKYIKIGNSVPEIVDNRSKYVPYYIYGRI